MRKTLVVIPAFNEEESIVSTLENLRAHCPDLDYLVVNDGSSDNTAELCRRQGVPLLDLATNIGLAGAVSTGMKYAYQHNYNAVIQFDSDGQHRPEYLPALIECLDEGYDIVCGSRFLTEPKPLSLRTLGSRMISLAIRLTTGKKLTDPTSGLRVYDYSIVQNFATQINMTPEPDTVSFLIKCGARVCEMQVTMNEREFGTSYLKPVASMKYMIRMAISILLLQPFRKHIALNVSRTTPSAAALPSKTDNHGW